MADDEIKGDQHEASAADLGALWGASAPAPPPVAPAPGVPPAEVASTPLPEPEATPVPEPPKEEPVSKLDQLLAEIHLTKKHLVLFLVCGVILIIGLVFGVKFLFGIVEDKGEAPKDEEIVT